MNPTESVKSSEAKALYVEFDLFSMGPGTV